MLSADGGPTTQHLCQRINKLIVDMEKMRELAPGLWQSDVEAYLEDLERILIEGKKIIGAFEPHYCWYHERFGAESQNCQEPCDFSTDSLDRNNFSWSQWDSDVLAVIEDLETLFDYFHHNPRNQDTEAERFCWYHERFGPESQSCQPPCDFDRTYYFREWCEQQVQVLGVLCEDMNLITEHKSHCDSGSDIRSQSCDASFSSSQQTHCDTDSFHPQDRSSSSSRDVSRDRSLCDRSRDQSYSPPRHVNDGSHDDSRDQFGDKSWTPPPNGYLLPAPSSEVMCWYHREFGESAKRCESPCEFYDYYCSAYSN